RNGDILFQVEGRGRAGAGKSSYTFSGRKKRTQGASRITVILRIVPGLEGDLHGRRGRPPAGVVTGQVFSRGPSVRDTAFSLCRGVRGGGCKDPPPSQLV